MTTTAFNDRLTRVTGALEEISPRFDATGNCSWQLPPRDAARCRVTAKLETDWLVLLAEDEANLFADASPWNLLQRNSNLPGMAKFAHPPNGDLQLRGELPLLDGANLTERIRETCAGFEAAISLYEFSQPQPVPESSRNKFDLKSLCTETGWPFIERGPDKLLVELEAADNFWQAALMQSEPGISLSCELAAFNSKATDSRDAAAEFLLSACGALRFARAAVSADVAKLEIIFAAPPCAAEISSALESLSVGVQLCGEEIKTLQDPAIARRYLAMRPRPSVGLNRQTK
jgi:hypothetical protein